MIEWLPVVRVLCIAALAFVAGWICGRMHKFKETMICLLTTRLHKDGSISHVGNLETVDGRSVPFVVELDKKHAQDMAKMILGMDRDS
jgi:hypothetical protein